jgi:hypothetical protein
MVFVLEHVVETSVKESRCTPETELRMRRDILVNELHAFHPADPAWSVPSAVLVRSSDSPDGLGRHCAVIKDMAAESMKFYSVEDYGNNGCWQYFDAQGDRLPAVHDEWARWFGRPMSAESRWVWFPSAVPNAPWGRPGRKGGGKSDSQHQTDGTVYISI